MRLALNPVLRAMRDETGFDVARLRNHAGDGGGPGRKAGPPKRKNHLSSTLDRGRRLMAATRGDSIYTLSLLTEMLPAAREVVQPVFDANTSRLRLLQKIPTPPSATSMAHGEPHGALPWGFGGGYRGAGAGLAHYVGRDRLSSTPDTGPHTTRHSRNSPEFNTPVRSNAGAQREPTALRA